MNIRLIVPRAYDEHNMNCRPIQDYGMAIANIAGGFTATQGTGGWIGPLGELIVEPVTVFDIAAHDHEGRLQPTIPEQFQTLAKKIAKELSQDCVYLSINGTVEYISA